MIADLTAGLLDHAIAEDIFFARLNSLDLGRLFTDSPVLGAVPGLSIIDYNAKESACYNWALILTESIVSEIRCSAFNGRRQILLFLLV